MPLNGKSSHGAVGVFVQSISCANSECEELTVEVELGRLIKSTYNGGIAYSLNDYYISLRRRILPEAKLVQVPESVPEEIRTTYREAALICDLSGRASAAMSRRCLQGMVRDFFDIPLNKRGNLGAELSQVQSQIDPDLWKAIQALRDIGDIGAHMDRDVNVIVDITPDEARLLLRLIETLFEQWYAARARRARTTSELTELVNSKREKQRERKRKDRGLSPESPSEDDTGPVIADHDDGMVG